MIFASKKRLQNKIDEAYQAGIWFALEARVKTLGLDKEKHYILTVDNVTEHDFDDIAKALSKYLHEYNIAYVNASYANLSLQQKQGVISVSMPPDFKPYDELLMNTQDAFKVLGISQGKGAVSQPPASGGVVKAGRREIII